MTRWEDLSGPEKTALRKLAKGEVHEATISGAPGEALDRFPLPALAVFVSADVRG